MLNDIWNLVSHPYTDPTESDRQNRRVILYLRSHTDLGLTEKRTIICDQGSETVITTVESSCLDVLERRFNLVKLEMPVRRGDLQPEGGLVLPANFDDWKDVVHEQMIACDLVLMCVGDTPGVSWEAHQLFACGVLPERGVFLLRGTKVSAGAKWGLLAELIEDRAGVSLPRLPDDREWEPYLVAFGRSWEIIITAIPHDAIEHEQSLGDALVPILADKGFMGTVTPKQINLKARKVTHF